MSALNPFAAGYRTRRDDPASSSPVFRATADATSSPSPPSSPILGAHHGAPFATTYGRSDAVLRPRTPPRAMPPSSPTEGRTLDSAAMEPPMFTSSSPSLEQGSMRIPNLSSSPSHRPSLDYPSSLTSNGSSTAVSSTAGSLVHAAFNMSDLGYNAGAAPGKFTHPLSGHSKATSLTAHPSFGKTFPHSKHPDPESPKKKRGVKRPLPSSPEKPTLRFLGGERGPFQPTASGSVMGRRTKRTGSVLASDDELTLDLAPKPVPERARDDVFRSLFTDSSDSSDESWPDSSSPPRHATELDGEPRPLEEDPTPAQETAPVTHMIVDVEPSSISANPIKPQPLPSATSGKVGLGLGAPLLVEERRPAALSRQDNPYRRTPSSFSRIASSSLPHPLSASYVPSPPAQSPAHSRPRLYSPGSRDNDDGLPARNQSPLIGDQASTHRRLSARIIASSSAASEASVWADAASSAFAQCQTSIVLDGRGLTSIDPMVADLGKMVTLPPPRASPPRDTTPGASAKRRSTEGTSDDYIPNLKFGGLQLHLANNRLTVLPSALFQVENLRVLSLRGNNLRFLPPAIGELSNLKELSIGGNQIEYLPAEIQKLRLTTFNYFPNPFRKPPTSLPCPSAHAESNEGAPKNCTHPPRFRVRTTWEQRTRLLLAQRPSQAADLAPPPPKHTSSRSANTTASASNSSPAPLRPKAAALSLRPLLLTNRSFGQSTFAPPDELRTPVNLPPEDPLHRDADATPLAVGSSSGGSDGGAGHAHQETAAARMPPPPAPFRVSEQGPRFANPSMSARRAAPLHTPTRLEEGTSIDMLQLGMPAPASGRLEAEAGGTEWAHQGEQDGGERMEDDRGSRVVRGGVESPRMESRAEMQPPDVRAQVPSLASIRPPSTGQPSVSSGSRRPRHFDRTRSERQITEMLEENGGDATLLSLGGAASSSSAAETALAPTPAVRLAPSSVSATAESSSPNPATTAAREAVTTIQIENGRASYVGPTERVIQGCPPLLGELCFRLLLGPSESAGAEPAAATAETTPTTPRRTAQHAAAGGAPGLVLDRWDRDELARWRNAQNLGVLRTLEAARQSAGRTWSGSDSTAAAASSERRADRNVLCATPGLDAVAAAAATAGPEGDDAGRAGDKAAWAQAEEDACTGHVRAGADAALDASANPWFSRCPNPAHLAPSASQPSTSTLSNPASPAHHGAEGGAATLTLLPSADWPIPAPQRGALPLFSRPAEVRFEWVSHVAGLRIARAGVNTSMLHHGGSSDGSSADQPSPSQSQGGPHGSGAAAAGQVVDAVDCLPILWRGCSRGCLDFLDQ